MPEFERLYIKIIGDSNLDKTVAKDTKTLSAFEKRLDAMFKKYGSRKISMEVEEDGAATTSAALKAVDKEADSVDGRTVNVQVDKDGKAAASLQKLEGGLHGVASGLRDISTVAAATTVLPGLIAGIGALPAIATAAAGATAQLGLALGQGLAGAVGIGMTAIGGAQVGLLAYKSLIGSTITASRELYLEENKEAQARIDAAKKTAFSTQANIKFNQTLDSLQISFIRLQGAIADRTFPMFTRELQAWGNLLPKLQGDVVDTAGAVSATAVSFSKWFRTAKDGDVLSNTVGFINGSAIKGAQALQNLGATGILAFQHVIGPATKLQKQIVELSRSMFNWTNSAEGASKISSIVDVLQHRFYQLLTIVKNVGSGLIGVFTALNNQGGPGKLMRGLVGLSEGFRHLMERGNGAREAIVTFMNRSNPLLNQLWKLAKTVVIQFGLLANNVVKAGQAGGKMGTLASVIAAIRKSVAPLRKMFEGTFLALGPVLAKLIPQAAKFAQFFLGSTGPLLVFLKGLTQLLKIFNSLPPGVKTTIVNLIALKTIMSSIGVGAFAAGIGRLATQYWAMSRASKASAVALGEYNAAQTGSTAATAGSTGVLARAKGGFSKLGGAIKAGGVALLGFGTIATGGVLLAIAALAAGAYLIYRNWGRITAALKPATDAFGTFFKAIQPVMAALRGALWQALKSVAKGFLAAVAPGLKLGGAMHSLSDSFANLAKRAIPPTVAALKAVTHWIEQHQQLFRILGKIVGTVVVNAFKAFGFILKNTARVVVGFVKVVGRIIKIFRDTDKGVDKSGKGIVSTVKGFTSSVARTIKSWGAALLSFWKNRIWDPIAKFLMNRADGMMQTLSNFRNHAISWVRSLVGAILNFWKDRVWQPIATFLINRAGGMIQTLGNFKDHAVSWVQSLPHAVGSLWTKFWQGMADWVVSKKEGILNTVWNLAAGVKNAWQSIAEFTNKILTTLGLKEGDTKPIPSPGPTQGTINAPGGGLNRPGAARGGLTSGTRADAWRAFGVTQMARGGVAKEPRLVYGEAGPEAYVTLGRYTKESAEALNKANDVWAKKGWLDRARRQRTHRHEDQNPGGKWGQGYSVSPVTHYSWAPEITDRVHKIASATGTKPNTYPGHGEPGGSSEKYTADFWGAGGRGSPIPKAMGYKTADLAINKYNSNPGVLYVIRQGEYWRGGHWSSNTYGDPHYDHTHVSWDSPGGAHATAVSRPNPKQAKFEKMWGDTINPWAKKWVARMSPASQLHRGAGAGTSKGVHSVYDWIDAKIPDMIGGGSLPSGSSPKGLTIGEALTHGGWPDSQLIKGSSTIWHESRGNAHAQNPSGARGLMQIMPQTASGVGASYSKLYDPVYNTSTGLKVFNQAGGWGPWVGAGMGGDYRNKPVTGYGRGGVIPGPKGKPALIAAHAGERVLPREVVRAFDRLAKAVERWSHKVGPRALGNEQERGDEQLREEVRKLRKEFVGEVRELRKKTPDAHDLLHMALRVQDSPAGLAGAERRVKRIVNREIGRLG